MEFNKSNCFNNKNKNQNLIHYKGVLGEFDYDPNIWIIYKDKLIFKDKDITSLPENLELPKGCISTSHMFRGCTNLTDITPLKNWNTSNVESTSYMFECCKNLTDIYPLQNWNTSNVTSMSEMFEYCINLKDISPLQDWEISNVTDMSKMFYGCTKLIR